MKILIIYQSIHHGNTKKIAQAMAEVLKAELAQPDELFGKNLAEYDLIGFGSGIYFGKHHRSLLNLIDTLPNLKSKRCFIFSTSGLKEGSIFNKFSKTIKTKLTAKEFNIIGEFACRGYDTTGPLKFIKGMHKGRPHEQDLAKARMFAESLL